MNVIVKSLAVLSAVFLLSACDTPTDGSSNANANGNNGVNGLNANGSTTNYLDKEGTVADRVFFELDSSQLDTESQQTLERQAAWFKQYPNLNITIEGHADERGTREYNIALGERRAAATKKFLTGLGIPSSRISTISYGKERPAVVGSDESAWSQNRRAVSVVTNQ